MPAGLAADPSLGAPAAPEALGSRTRCVAATHRIGRVAVAAQYGEAVTATGKGWTFLTNHGHVLVCLATDPNVRLRDVADRVGITERAVQQIVADLEEGGYVLRERVGRRNRYTVERDGTFRHPIESGVTVGDFLDLVIETTSH